MTNEDRRDRQEQVERRPIPWGVGQWDYLVLMRGSTRLGTFTAYTVDQPWFVGVFKATPAFQQYRQLFDDELRWLNEPGFDVELWEKAYRRIQRLRMVMMTPNGTYKIREFLLHIEGEQTRLRC